MTPGAASADTLSLTPLSLGDLNGGNQLLQTGFWGSFKSEWGWIPRAYAWSDGGGEGFGGRFLVLERSIPGGLKMAYVPYGPALPDGLNPDESVRILAAIARVLKAHLSGRCIFIRFDLCGGTRGPVREDPAAPLPLKRPLRPAPYRVQPPDTVILSLDGDDGALLAGMHKKTRYNIRLAEKKGVVIRRYTGNAALKELPDWYELYGETGRRDGISLHPESYYRRLFEQAFTAATAATGGEGGPGLSLYMAGQEGESLAGIIVSRTGSRSVYMYGASSGRKREIMPNHLLQWRAIRDARDEGASEYDFFGIPPADDPSHPMHGLWRFKTGFGGVIVHYQGAWDFPYSLPLYRLYAGAEQFRGWTAALRKRRRG